LIDGEVISRMRPGAYLVNTSRGGVVDEAALYSALTIEGPLAGAALDVHELEGEGVHSRFEDLPNVVMTPHIGAMAIEAQAQIGDRILAMIQAFEDDTLATVLREGEHVV
jgi:phosphoglycerate dehydrogenase-like enzyme